CLGGIGFTMSIFVDTLSFSAEAPEVAAQMRDAGKIAVLLGSLCSGALGALLVNLVYKGRKQSENLALGVSEQ
ncbi:MAG: Na+/H+ antiporter NhaA, partial [Bacteroidales bacterium]|nr:Na+/H+ antiporter NhaA [Bacteroidales bacterium]